MKNFYLLSALALASMTVNAQEKTWTSGSEIGAGKYIIYNIESGGYLDGGFDSWGTNGGIYKNPRFYTLAASGSGYTIDTQVSNGGAHFMQASTWLDGNAVAQVFTPVSKEGYSLAYAFGNGGNSFRGNGMNKTLSLDGGDASKEWLFISEADYRAALSNHTADGTYINATALINGARVYRNFTNGIDKAGNWTETHDGNINLNGGNNQYRASEFFHGTFDIYQTISGIPNGVYQVGVNAFQRTATGEKNAVLYANDEQVQLMALSEGINNTCNDMTAAGKAFAEDDFNNWLFVTVTDGTLKIGIKRTQVFGSWTDWCIFNNFSLRYYGDGASVDALSLLVAISEAKEQMNKTANAALKQQLSEAIAAAETVASNPDATAAECDAAKANLEGPAKAVAESAARYATAGAEIEKINKAIANTNLYTPEAINAWNDIVAKYNDGTLTNEEAGAIYASEYAWHGNGGVNTVDDILLSAWTVGGAQAKDYDKSLYINTWSVEADNKTNGSGVTVPFYEYWVGDGATLGANTLEGSIAGVKPGIYKVEALVRVRTTDGKSAPSGIKFVTNGGEEDATNGATCDDGAPFRYKTVALPVTVGEDGILKCSFVVEEGNTCSWLSFKNVKYTEISAEDVANADAFKAAVAAAEEKVANLGFMEGEYAPYNNVEVIKAYSAAKAINPYATPADDVKAATSALTSATWTANTEEVNAIYNGDFALCENDGAMPGWTMTNNTLGGAYHSRAFVLTSGMNNYDKLAAFEQGDGVRSAAYFRFDGTNSDRGSMYRYGEVEGYTMPLKGGSSYLLQFDLGGWGQKQNTRFYVTGPKWLGEVYKVPSGQVNNGSATDHVILVLDVPEGADGNYVLHIQNPSGDVNNAIILSNFKFMSLGEDQRLYNADIATLDQLDDELKAVNDEIAKNYAEYADPEAAAEIAKTLADDRAEADDKYNNDVLKKGLAYEPVDMDPDALSAAIQALLANVQEAKAIRDAGEVEAANQIALVDELKKMFKDVTKRIDTDYTDFANYVASGYVEREINDLEKAVMDAYAELQATFVYTPVYFDAEDYRADIRRLLYEAGRRAANAAAYSADVTAIAELQVALNVAKAEVIENYADFEDVEATAAIQSLIDDLSAQADAHYAKVAEEGDYENVELNASIILDAAKKLVADASIRANGDEGEATAIEKVFAGKASGIYTISGQKVDTLQKGINIVVDEAGKAKKILK